MKANLDLVRNESDKKAMTALFESRDAEEFSVRLAAVPQLKDRSERLSPSRYINGIRARLIVVHLGSDPCVPSSESVRMVEPRRLSTSHTASLFSVCMDTPARFGPEFGIESFLGSMYAELEIHSRAG